MTLSSNPKNTTNNLELRSEDLKEYLPIKERKPFTNRSSKYIEETFKRRKKAWELKPMDNSMFLINRHLLTLIAGLTINYIDINIPLNN